MNENCAAKPAEGESTSQYKKKWFMNIDLKRGFRVFASRIFKEILEVSGLSFKQEVERLNSECLTGWKIPGVVRINSNPFYIRCSKGWICRLGFIYGSCTIVLHYTFFFQRGNS
jgi:hypothetical protein